MTINARSLISAWLLLPIPALAAQAPLAADSQAITTCLASAAEGIGTQCIGVVANPCIKALKDDDTSGTKAKACAARELAVWEAQLGAAVKTVKAGGFAAIAKSVSNARKSWLASREALCPVFDKIDPGKFLGGTNYCRLHETAERALILRKLGAAVNEH
jgi:hypothetical protein